MDLFFSSFNLSILCYFSCSHSCKSAKKKASTHLNLSWTGNSGRTDASLCAAVDVCYTLAQGRTTAVLALWYRQLEPSGLYFLHTVPLHIQRRPAPSPTFLCRSCTFGLTALLIARTSQAKATSCSFWTTFLLMKTTSAARLSSNSVHFDHKQKS